MLQRRRRLDLDHEPLGAEHRGEFRLEHLDRDLAIVLEVVREIDRGHAARAELALDAVAISRMPAQGVGVVARMEPGEEVFVDRSICSAIRREGRWSQRQSSCTIRRRVWSVYQKPMRICHDDSRRDQRPSRLIALRSSGQDTLPPRVPCARRRPRTSCAWHSPDRYRIERELGAGGMATVYLAADLKHDRNVAIKVLKPELAAVLGAERFVVEIKTTAALQHPHILPLFDSGTVDGIPVLRHALHRGRDDSREARTARRSSASTRRCASRAKWPTRSTTRIATA